LGGPVDDGNGDLIAGTKTPSLPEPSTALMLLAGLGVYPPLRSRFKQSGS